MDKDWFYGIVSSNFPSFTFNALARPDDINNQDIPLPALHATDVIAMQVR